MAMVLNVVIFKKLYYYYYYVNIQPMVIVIFLINEIKGFFPCKPT